MIHSPGTWGVVEVNLSEIVFVVGIVVGIFVVFYGCCILPTQWLKVERVQFPLSLNTRIVQISDIHIERNRVRLATLERVIRMQAPDLICLTGDFVDTRDALLRLVPFLRMIRSLQTPTFAVLGNHDYRVANPHELVELLESFDIRVLSNETSRLERFNLVGIDDYCTRHDDEEMAFKDVQLGKPTVIITHDPTLTLSIRHSFDYLMSGHLHGRQFALPWVFHFQPMGPLAASGVYQGLHRCDQGTYYISKGIGQSGVNLRFLVRSEITVHEL